MIISNVKKGDLGGFVETESNLSHEGKCWIYKNAKLYDYGWIDAVSKLYGNAIICNHASICGGVEVYENSVLKGCLYVDGVKKIHGKVHINSNCDERLRLEDIF